MGGGPAGRIFLLPAFFVFVGEGAFFSKNCPFPHTPNPEKTFIKVWRLVPVVV